MTKLSVNVLNNITNDLKSLSNNLRDYIESNLNYWKSNNKKKYTSKISVYDAILFRLLYTSKYASHLSVRASLNNYSGRTLHRSAYEKSEKKIDNVFYDKLSEYLFDLNCQYLNEDEYFIAFDGTYASALIPLRDNVDVSMIRNKCVYGLFNVAYDVFIKCPITLDLAQGLDERIAFIDFIKRTPKYHKATFIFDRGYFSHLFILELEKIGIKYILRVEDDHNFVDKKIGPYDKRIQLKYDNNNILGRILRYYENDNTYNILTNLKAEYSFEIIKNLYHKRWSIEEYIKVCKINIKAEYYPCRSKINILKTIKCNLILTQLGSLVEKIINKHMRINDKDVINRKTLYLGIYTKLLMDLLYGTISLENSKLFCSSYVHYQRHRPYRYYERNSENSYFKWHRLRRINIMKKI